MNELILVVDDEARVVKLARDYLEKAGFQVHSADDGNTALAAARQEKPDLIVLDLGLPGMDGLDVCRILRRESDVPIIMLTARVEETDRLIGLEIGADDYITKPFSPRELVARVRTVLRRVQGGVRQPGLLRAADLEIDLEGHRVTREGAPVQLCASNSTCWRSGPAPGQTFSRAQHSTAARLCLRWLRPQHRRSHQEPAPQLNLTRLSRATCLPFTAWGISSMRNTNR
jgi:two-component system alkaline phosphatase synthesis response regulator PhoP